MPLQPNDDRGIATLNAALDNHVIATTGYSNFPGYIPNYAGDEDSGLEAVIPDLVRKTRAQAHTLLDSINLDWVEVAHTLTASYIESTGKTVRVTAYDHNWNSWGGGYPEGALIGLRKGDQVNIDASYISNTVPTSLTFSDVTVTAINVDGSDSWFEFELTTAPETPYDYELLNSVTIHSTVYAGTNLVNVITMQRANYEAGMIVDEYTGVHVRYFED
jgi:hypothetical protein